jgi:hypothetical protein
MNDYIPKSDDGFDGFQRNFMTLIAAIASAAGIPASAINVLLSYQTEWENAFAVGGQAQKSTRNSVQTRTKTEARKAYQSTYAPQPMGLRAFIAAWVKYNPLISDAQRISLGVPVPSRKKTQHTVATKNQVVFKSKGLEGGVVQTDCYSSGSNALNPVAVTAKMGKRTGRDRKEAGYDILKSWKIIPQSAALPATANDAGMVKTLFTKAKIIKQLGAENKGMILCEFLQWYIPEHPELAGPWSEIQTCIIT